MFKIDKYEYDTQTGFLGEGSFGKVYKGKCTETGETVAVKCMEMEAFRDPFMLDSLKNEINVMAQLTSPNVVKMFAVFQDAKTTYIILEFCEEGDLNKFIRNNGGLLSEEKGCEVLAQLLNGFKNLYENGYIHRDIKPANALVEKGIFKVADFGFATKIDITGRQLIQECVGTPLYMAPQLLENIPYTAKSDIWSIGMLFFEMLFGKTPWPCRDLQSFLRNMKTQPLRFPYGKPISNETKTFIQQCLQVNESQRISWEELLDHPLMKGRGAVVEPTINLDEKAQQIIRQMQNVVQTHNLDIGQIFGNFDQDYSGQLNQQEFYKMMNVIDSRITGYEANHIFNLVDASQDGHVNRDEFQKLFLDYDFSDLSDKAGQIIIDLKEIIKANNIKIESIFSHYDKDKGGVLEFNEFAKLIKVVAPGLRDYEILDVFKKFDQNQDGTVDFNEFYQKLAYGLEGQDPSYDPLQEKANKLINKLKEIIQQHQLQVGQIFANFEQNQDGNLDINEFTNICHVIDKNLNEEDVKAVFRQFDKNQTGSVSYDEFYKVLQ